MKNYTKEVIIMFIGCLLIIFSSNETSVNFTLMIIGLVVVLISIILFIRTNKQLKKEQKDEKDDS